MVLPKNVNLTRLCRGYLTAYANISKLRYSSCKNGPFCKNPKCPCKLKPVKPSVPPWDPPSPPNPCDSPLTNSCVSAAPKTFFPLPPSCGDCPASKPCNSPALISCNPPPLKFSDLPSPILCCPPPASPKPCDPPSSPKYCDPYSHILLDLPLIPFSPYDFPPCPDDYLPHASCDAKPSPCDFPSPSTFESFYGSLKSDSLKLNPQEPLGTPAPSWFASSDTQQPKCSPKEAPKEEPIASTCPLAAPDKGKHVCTPTVPGGAKIRPSISQPKELPENFSVQTAKEFCIVTFQKCLDFCLRSLNRK